MSSHASGSSLTHLEEPLLPGLRRRVGALFVDGLFTVLANLGRLHPWARSAPGVERTRNIPYRDSGKRAHLLDVYRPTNRTGPLPVVLHIHGGSFRILSKDTHWSAGVHFAQAGCVCFNINYRLAPKARFPLALEDAVEAYRYVLEHAESYGGDPNRLIIAGESAGGNLTLALAVAATYAREEPVCRRLFELDHRPMAILPTCGILDLEDPERFARMGVRSAVVMDRIRNVSYSYLPVTGEAPMASPLRILESGQAPDRPFPPTFVGCGDADPILDDSRRLRPAVEALGGRCVEATYERQPHAFNLLFWTAAGRRFWGDATRFLHDADPAIRSLADQLDVD